MIIRALVGVYLSHYVAANSDYYFKRLHNYIFLDIFIHIWEIPYGSIVCEHYVVWTLYFVVFHCQNKHRKQIV